MKLSTDEITDRSRFERFKSNKGNQLFSFWIIQECMKRQKIEQDDKLRVEETIERIKAVYAEIMKVFFSVMVSC